MLKITKRDKELHFRCNNNCKICMNDGGCSLQNKIKKYGDKAVRIAIDKNND